MKTRKLRIEEVVVMVLAGCLMIIFACSEKALTPQIITPQMIQAEAKQMLQQIYTVEQAYWQQKGVYFVSANVAGAATPNVFADIGITIAPTARYSYALMSADISYSFIGWAVHHSLSGLDEDDAADVWLIDHHGSLVCISDDAIN